MSISQFHQISYSLPGNAVYQAQGIGGFSRAVGSLARTDKAINDGTSIGHSSEGALCLKTRAALHMPCSLWSVSVGFRNKMYNHLKLFIL